MRPFEQFMRVEAASGIVLAIATLLALAWANSPFRASYEALWHLPIGVRLGAHELAKPLHFWINEGLMTVFFFMVGLEIRWELHEGSLASIRAAFLPVVAAIGGMVAPPLLYLSLNHASAGASGWAVVIATDIAFALGVLTLLGRRVPPALRVLLLALAVIDDIGAILVIAVVFSTHVSLVGLVVAAGGAGAVYLLRKLGVRSLGLYLAPALLLWGGLLTGGIHPTLAGVVLGLLAPVDAWYGREGFAAKARAIGDALLEARDERSVLDLLRQAHIARREALPLAVAWRARLHPAVSFLVLPLFALANAGVSVRQVSLGDPSERLVAIGIVVGLVVGKPLGIVLASYVAVRARLAALPEGVSWRGVSLVGVVAGVGFTMAIFLSELGFEEGPLQSTAKLAVLIASTTAAALSMGAGLTGLHRRGSSGT
jgi:NhaA family Na+:H+ antiporter